MSYCPNLGTLECNPCRSSEKGRIRAIAIVTAGAPLPDPSSQQDWYNLLCNDLAVIIYEDNFRGALEVEANKATGYGAVVDQTVDFNYNLKGYSKFECSNADFFNNLNYANQGYEVYMATETKVMHSGAPVNFTIMTPISEDVNSVVETMFEITFTSEKGQLECFDKPSVVFDNCETINRLAACFTCEPITISAC